MAISAGQAAGPTEECERESRPTALAHGTRASAMTGSTMFSVRVAGGESMSA
jgi:hypothetical protein